MAIVTTPGSSSANAYISNADADTMVGNFFPSTIWTDNASKQDAALTQAAIDIDLYIMGRYQIRRLIDGDYISGLLYPFYNFHWYRDSYPRGHYEDLTADGGSNTTAVFNEFSGDSNHITNYCAGGSLFVHYTSDNAAPRYELQAVSAYNRATYTVTTAAFTTAIASGDMCYLVHPIPDWLKKVNVMQAIWRIENKGGARENYHKGIASESSQGGGSTSYVQTGVGGHLSQDVERLIDANLRQPLRLVRC